MSKDISNEFLRYIDIQNKKLGDFIQKLLVSLNLCEPDNSDSRSNYFDDSGEDWSSNSR